MLKKINKSSVCERAKIFRDKVQYDKDKDEAGYIELINREHWCHNRFYVTRQVSIKGTYRNRYDVTLLMKITHCTNSIETERTGTERSIQ